VVAFPWLHVPRSYRLLAVSLLGLWMASNCLPCAQVIEGNRHAARIVEPMIGLRLTALGWAWPAALSFAWYANIPYLYSIWKLFRGQTSRPAAMIAFGLALTALLPHVIYSEVDGWHRAYIVGPALCLWLCSFAINLVPTRLSFRALPLPGTS
jgi:hypothetical protein